MEDFASAAMMRLIRAGLARQGFAAGPAGSEPGAHVPLASKREALRRIAERHGAMALLRIGEALESLRDEPALAAMERAESPEDAVERWRRLERYVHSRHRTEALSSEPGRLVLRHVAVSPHEPPLREEDFLVFGLLVALVRRTGAKGLRARPRGAEGWAFEGCRTSAPGEGESAVWIIEWDRVEPGRGPDPAACGRRALGDILRRDLTRRWTVGTAARELGRSPRSLQRLLHEQGKPFSRIVADIRAAAAVRLLEAEEERDLAEIGFLCGYADQAHFTRAFRAALATTPRAFRMNAIAERARGDLARR
ncbi:MAG: helix-turn-helix transcriptional regulator [Pikeienuella sp.]|uniref:helix-turn-helix transcriptional regulator n=1 Tax=Pikeienuella sp. TaxID=2831957 RepID=UPI00391D006E